MTWNDKIVSIIRTAVPALVGAVLTWLIGQVPAVGDVVTWLNATLNVDVSALLAAAAVAGLTAAYYALVRWAAQRWPWVEVLLGSPKAPTAYVAASSQTTPSPPDVDTAGPRAPDPQRDAAIAACHEDHAHLPFRYCPSCPWTEDDPV